MTHSASILFATGGLGGLHNSLVQDWLGPAFLIAIACFAIMFLRDRAWMKLAGFIAIAAIVGVLIYDSGSLFGSSSNNSGSFGNIANNAASQIGSNSGGGK